MTTTTKTQDYIQNIERRLDRLEGELRQFETQVHKAVPRPSEKLATLKEAVATKRQALRSKLSSAKQTSDSAWKEVQIGLDSAWTELTAAFDRAKQELKKESTTSEAPTR